MKWATSLIGFLCVNCSLSFNYVSSVVRVSISNGCHPQFSDLCIDYLHHNASPSRRWIVLRSHFCEEVGHFCHLGVRGGIEFMSHSWLHMSTKSLVHWIATITHPERRSFCRSMNMLEISYLWLSCSLHRGCS